MIKVNNILIRFILSVFILSGCQKDDFDNWWDDDDTYLVSDVLYPQKAKLKQISELFFGSGREISYKLYLSNETSWFVQYEYEYDNKGRISKVSWPWYENGKLIRILRYYSYTYNAKSQLEKIMDYSYVDVKGFINDVTYIYSYDKNGNKLKEVVEYRSGVRADSTLYYYDKNNRLIREEYSYGGIEYEYNNQNELIQEISYYAPPNHNMHDMSKHTYQNGLKVKTESFYLSDYYGNVKNVKAKEIRRYYDKNKNLIYLEDEAYETVSSYTNYILKYVYY